MNILLINHYAGSPKHGMEYRPYYMAKEWLKAGHQVTIVTANQSHLRIKNPDMDLNISLEIVDGINYLWIKTPPYQGNNVSRVINMFTFISKLLFHSSFISEKFSPDVVIASSTYPLDIYPAYRIAKKNKAKLIFEVHDLWPLSPMELGNMSPWHPFIFTMQMAEDFAYQRANKVVSMLPNASSHMIAHGMSPDKFIHIPNGIDTLEWQKSFTQLPDIYLSVLQELKEKKKFIVGYAGSHGIANALHVLIEAASLLQGSDISFVLIGQGPEKEHLVTFAQSKNIDNVHFLPPIAKEHIPTLLAMMDALYIGWNKNPLYRFGISPNKLLDYMMAAKPVIHAIEAANDLVAESSCGISVPPDSPQEIAAAIKRLSDTPRAKLEIMGQNGKEYVNTHHDYRILAQKFLDEIGV